MNGHAYIVLAENQKLVLPVYVTAMRCDVFVKQLFMLSLLDDEHKRIRAHAVTDILEHGFAANNTALDHADHFGWFAKGDEFIGKTDLLVDLQRSCLYADCPRK